jgi:hypothetical protein
LVTTKIVRFTFAHPIEIQRDLHPSSVTLGRSRRPVPGPRPRRFVATVSGALGAVGFRGLEVGRGHGGVETRRCHDGVWGETQSLVPWEDFGMFFWDVFLGMFFWDVFLGCSWGLQSFLFGDGGKLVGRSIFGGENRCLWILFFWGGRSFFFIIEALDV